MYEILSVGVLKIVTQEALEALKKWWNRVESWFFLDFTRLDPRPPFRLGVIPYPYVFRHEIPQTCLSAYSDALMWATLVRFSTKNKLFLQVRDYVLNLKSYSNLSNSDCLSHRTWFAVEIV